MQSILQVVCFCIFFTSACIHLPYQPVKVVQVVERSQAEPPSWLQGAINHKKEYTVYRKVGTSLPITLKKFRDWVAINYEHQQMQLWLQSCLKESVGVEICKKNAVTKALEIQEYVRNNLQIKEVYYELRKNQYFIYILVEK